MDSGVIATYIYCNVNRHDSKWSIDGYIDIKSISIDSISGTFSFRAKGDATNPDTVYIDEGKFTAIYGGGDYPWSGPK